MKPGFYKVTGRGAKKIMDKVDQEFQLWTKGGADSADNNFEKGPILANVEFVKSGKAYVLLANEVYRIPWVVVISVEVLNKFTLTPVDWKLNKIEEPVVLDGWRGHNKLVELYGSTKT